MPKSSPEISPENQLLENQLLEKIRNALLQTRIKTLVQSQSVKEATEKDSEEVSLFSEIGEEAITSLKLEPQRIFIVVSLPQRLIAQVAEIEAVIKKNIAKLQEGRELALVMTSSANAERAKTQSSPNLESPNQNSRTQGEQTQGAKTQGAKTQGAKTIPPPKTISRTGGIKNVKTILAIASGKGGVGKSTLAVNISIALAQMQNNAKKLKIGLLDADLYGPSLVQMLALDKPPQRNSNDLIIPEKRFGISTLSMGAMIKDGQALVWRGPLIGRALKQLLEGSDWGQLDILVLDLPPGTGDLPLTLAQNACIDAAMLVSTPQQVALYDVRKSQNMFDKLRVPIVGIVENMSSFKCQNCGAESHIFGSGGAKTQAKDTKIPFLGSLPISQALQESGDIAMPIMALSQNSGESHAETSSKEDAQKDAETDAETDAESNLAGARDSRASGENARQKNASQKSNNSVLKKAHSLHIQELRENIRSIATNLTAQLEQLQKNKDLKNKDPLE